jgi:SnoaL-like domain
VGQRLEGRTHGSGIDIEMREVYGISPAPERLKVMTSHTTVAESAVLDLIETYRQGFLRLEPKRLESIWDQEHDPLVYVAMELPEPLLNWAAIERYLEALPVHVETILAKEIVATTVDIVGESAVAFFQFHSTVKLKGNAELYRPSGRVSMVLRQTRAGWRAIHYHESALAAQSAEQRRRLALAGEKTPGTVPEDV